MVFARYFPCTVWTFSFHRPLKPFAMHFWSQNFRRLKWIIASPFSTLRFILFPHASQYFSGSGFRGIGTVATSFVGCL